MERIYLYKSRRASDRKRGGDGRSASGAGVDVIGDDDLLGGVGQLAAVAHAALLEGRMSCGKMKEVQARYAAIHAGESQE